MEPVKPRDWTSKELDDLFPTPNPKASTPRTPEKLTAEPTIPTHQADRLWREAQLQAFEEAAVTTEKYGNYLAAAAIRALAKEKP